MDFDLSYDDLIRELTLVGLESDPAPEPEFNFEKVVAGKIVEYCQADGGAQLKVDVGSEVLPIYCTAPGLKEGQLIALALVGGRVSSKVIEPAEFDGKPSNGMACSEAELGLGTHATSLMLLDPNEMKPGDDLAAYLRSDSGIEIELTANRSDCWSLLGIAREVGAICGTKVKPIKLRDDLGTVKKKDESIEVRISCPALSHAYFGLFFPEVKPDPSPLPIVRKLISVGLRPINVIVDITNLVLYELGQPSHAFDYDLIRGGFIEVRLAKPGEKVTTLDDVVRDLTPGDLVIADGSGPVALAGVMGGHSSEITSDTKRMFLENAHFDPASIRRTSRRTGLRTDASMRFERGIDPAGIRRSAQRIAWWVEKLGCGKVAPNIIEVSFLKDKPKIVVLRDKRIEKVLGCKVEDERIDGILSGLGFGIQRQKGKRKTTVPSFRLDVSIEEDLIEEIARHFRYENLPTELPMVHMKQVAYDPNYAAARHFKNILSGLGLWEVATYATGKAGLIDMEDPIDPSRKPIAFINPLTEDHTMLRTHLLPSLLLVIRHNLRRGVEPLDVFEIANVFHTGKGEGFEKYDQRRQIGILSVSKRGRGKTAVESEEKGYLHIKGVVGKFITAIGGEIAGFDLLPETHVYPFKVGINSKDGDWGIMGRVADSLVDDLDIPYSAHYALLRYDMAKAQYESGLITMKYTSLERFPSVIRDLALVVKESILYGELAGCIRETAGEHLREMKLFDVFRSDKIGTGKKQFAVSLRFNHPDRTLTDDEVDLTVASIITAASKRFDAKLRDW